MLIAVTGQAGSGKSLVADYLSNVHDFWVLSFAAPIKEVAAVMFDFTEEQLWGPSEMRSTPHPTLRRPDGSPLTARYALQVLGTDVARACSPDVWVNMAMRTADAHAACGRRSVFSDCRYQNELAAIRARGGKVIRRVSTVPLTDTHPSEREMAELPDDAFDAVVPHYADKANLYAHVDALVKEWSR